MIRIKPLSELIGVTENQVKHLVYKKHYYQLKKKFGNYYIEYELAKCIALKLQHKSKKTISEILADIDSYAP